MTDPKPNSPAPIPEPAPPDLVAGAPDDARPSVPQTSGGPGAEKDRDEIGTRPPKRSRRAQPARTPKPFGGVDLAALRVHEDLQRSLGPRLDLEQALRPQRELLRALDQKNALARAAEELIRADGAREASGIQAMMREMEASARQHRQWIESMALSTAMRHSLAQMQKTIEVDAAHRRLFEHQTAFLKDIAFAKQLDALAKQTSAPSAPGAADQAMNVTAQLAAMFAQEKPRGLDALAIYNALLSRPTVSASLAATLAGLSLADAPGERERVESVVRQAAAEALARSPQAASSERAAPPVEVAAGDRSLAALAADVWTKLAASLQHLSPDRRIAILAIIVPALLSVGAMVMQWQQGVEATRSHAEDMRASESVKETVRALTAVVTRQQRFVAQRAKPLRANPEASAKRVGTVPQGATLVLRYRVERWLFVTVADGDAAGSEGWVFLRDLRPVGP